MNLTLDSYLYEMTLVVMSMDKISVYRIHQHCLYLTLIST